MNPVFRCLVLRWLLYLFCFRIDHGSHVSTLIVSVRNLATRGQWRVTISGSISTASLLRERLEIRAVLKPGVAAAFSDEGGKDPRHRTVLEGFSEAPSFVLQLDDVQVGCRQACANAQINYVYFDNAKLEMLSRQQNYIA